MSKTRYNRRIYVDEDIHDRIRILSIQTKKEPPGKFVKDLLEVWEEHQNLKEKYENCKKKVIELNHKIRDLEGET